MKGTLLAYSRQLLAWSQSAAQVSQEWGALYAHSATRAQSLSTFTTNQSRIERCALGLYKDTYGWDILKVFDDWESEAQRVLGDIAKTEKARDQVSGLDEKVRSLRAAKERRLKSGGTLDKKEETSLESNEAMLDKYNVLLSNMRFNLDKNLAQFFEQRFGVLDRAFVRFMEIQIEFFRESAAASANYQSIVDNYRKRFPRAAKGAEDGGANPGQYGPTPDVMSPLPAVASHAAANGVHDHDVLNLPITQQPRSKSTPPEENGVQQQQQAQRKPAHVHHAHHAQHAAHNDRPRRPTHHMGSAPIDADDSGSDSDTSSSESDHDHTDSSDDEHHDATPKQPTPARRVTSGEPVLDLLWGSDSPPAKKQPVNSKTLPASLSSKPQQPAEDTLLDFFTPGSGASAPPPSAAAAGNKKPSPTSAAATTGRAAAHTASPADFFSAGGSSHNLSAPNSKLPQSVSSPALNNVAHASKQKAAAPLDPFDPFSAPSPMAAPAASSSSSGSSSASAGSSSSRPTRSHSPPPNAPGTSQSGLVNAPQVATHALNDHIEEQQRLKIKQLQEAQEAEEAALEARRNAEGGLEATLTAWECNKDGTRVSGTHKANTHGTLRRQGTGLHALLIALGVCFSLLVVLLFLFSFPEKHPQLAFECSHRSLA